MLEQDVQAHFKKVLDATTCEISNVRGAISSKVLKSSEMYYTVITYVVNGERKQVTDKTDIEKPYKNEKKQRANDKAVRELLESRRTLFENMVKSRIVCSNMKFSDFMLQWLENMRGKLEKTSFGGYQSVVNRAICPAFSNVSLCDVTPKLLQEFYDLQIKKGLSVATVKRYHANIHKALKQAVAQGLILSNPSDYVELAKPDDVFTGEYYSLDELKQLLQIIRGNKLEVPVLLASYYGFRRSEVVGLRWKEIDFQSDTVTISYKVTQASVDGKFQLVQSKRTKSVSSYRTLPLMPEVKEALLAHKKHIEQNRQLFGNGYCQTYQEFICVDDIGELIRPDWLTRAFPVFLIKHSMRKIRFHDLRHTAATLLRHNGADIEEIMEWLGHSSITMTLRYAHEDDRGKRKTAGIMENLMK